MIAAIRDIACDKYTDKYEGENAFSMMLICACSVRRVCLSRFSSLFFLAQFFIAAPPLSMALIKGTEA